MCVKISFFCFWQIELKAFFPLRKRYFNEVTAADLLMGDNWQGVPTKWNGYHIAVEEIKASKYRTYVVLVYKVMLQQNINFYTNWYSDELTKANDHSVLITKTFDDYLRMLINTTK